MINQRQRVALDKAWTNAKGAEAADAAGHYEDRDVRISLANMWSQIALAEAEVATTKERVNNGSTDRVRQVR